MPPITQAGVNPEWRKTLDTLGVPLLFFFVFFGIGATQPHLTDYARHLAAGGSGDARRLFGQDQLNLAPLLVTAIYAVFAPSRLLGVWAISRIGRAWTIRAGTFLYLCLGISLFVGGSPWVPLIGCVSIGVGAGLLWTASATHVLDYSGGRYGFASGALHTLSRSGMWIGVSMYGSLVAAHGYTGHPFHPFGMSLVLGGLALMVSFGLRSRPVAAFSPTPRRLANALRRPALPLVGGLLFLAFFGYGLLLSHMMPLVQERFAASGASFLGSIYFVAGLVVAWPAGALSDRWGRWPVMLGAYACGGASMLLMTRFSPSCPLWVPVAAMALLGVPFGAVPPAATALIGDVADPRERPLVHACAFIPRDLGVVAASVLAVWMGRLSNPAAGFRGMAVVFFLPVAVGAAARFAKRS